MPGMLSAIASKIVDPLMFKLNIIVLILLIFLNIPSGSLSDEIIDGDIIYQGCFPDGIGSGYLQVGRFIGDSRDFIAVSCPEFTKTCVEIFQFINDDWVFVNRISLPIFGRYMRWTVGDINNDNGDEIITCVDSLITVYYYKEKSVTKNVFALDSYIYKVIVGDINNDEENELILLCCSNRIQHIYQKCLYTLVIAKIDGNNIDVIWNDEQKLGIYSEDVTLPRFENIMDFEGLGGRCPKLS